MFREWSKSIGWGGLGQRGGGSSVFEPLIRGGSFNFQLPMGDGPRGGGGGVLGYISDGDVRRPFLGF